MPFVTTSVSSAGGRTENEDSVGHLQCGDTNCWVVADGLGGHGGGATASRIAVDTVLASFRANPAVTAEAMTTHLQAAHAAVRKEQAQPSLAQMKSTLVVLLANESTALCGHVGDSRLYYVQGGRIAFQTQDQSVPGALAASGAISPAQIRFHEDRNRLLRSIGGENDITPAIEKRNLHRHDAFLLCSDGFWEYVNELEMEVDFVKSTSPDQWLKFMLARLLPRAKTENDNYTATAVFFDSPTAPEPPEPQKTRPETTPKPAAARPVPAQEKTGAGHNFAVVLTVFLALSLVFMTAIAATAKLFPHLVPKAVQVIERKNNARPSQTPAKPAAQQESTQEANQQAGGAKSAK